MDVTEQVAGAAPVACDSYTYHLVPVGIYKVHTCGITLFFLRRRPAGSWSQLLDQMDEIHF